MIARSPARFLAPLAVIAFIVAAVIAISGANSDTGSRRGPVAPVVHKHVPKVYKVRTGDGLGRIASRFGVPVARILELNPEVDPRNLQAGDQLRLR